MIDTLYETTELTLAQIAERMECSLNSVWKYVRDNYSKEYRQERKKRNYAKSKVGDKNPMYGKVREQHHNYQERISDGKGYWLVLKPAWWTGREGSKHVFEHQVVLCQALGLTELPMGFCVHHVDKDKLNNSIDNLALLTKVAHQILHAHYE